MTIDFRLRAYFRNRFPVGLRNASTRDEWVATVLKNLPPGYNLLDAGAGECQYKSHCGHLDYVSQDFSQYDGAGNNRGLQTGSWDTSTIDIVSDIVSIPRPDASFDAILCTEVFEHLPDPSLAIREFARLLKAGGQLIITAPFISFTHFAPYHFATGFNRYYYLHHLKQNGFDDIQIYENGNYFELMGQELRRISSMSENFCGRNVGVLTTLSVAFLLFVLDRMSKADQGSKELANFGLHVIARKIPNHHVT